jgi:amino acid transporter
MTDTVEAEKQPELKRVMGPGLLLLFIVGDILGTGVYALTGDVAAEVGGAAWLPFLVAFLIAMVTAFSYLELVTKYPQAAGAALYTHKAFGIHFATFLVAFIVMCSGITSASTASRFFASNFFKGFGFDWGTGGIVAIALLFMVLVAAVNLRGVGESVKLNVVLTIVEVTGLMLVIFVGLWAFTRGGDVDFSRVIAFDTAENKNAFLAVTTATSLAFFAMVGFEDSVNMAEETKDPVRIFPKMMITGISVTGVIYVLIALCSVALVPVGVLADSDTPLVTVVETAAPGIPVEQILPFISLFAVANSALINMLMASRLLYGMARQAVLPPFLGKVHRTRRTPYAAIIFTTALSLAVIVYVSQASSDAVAVLGGTTSLLLLGVFTIVNICVLVLRRRDVDKDRIRTDLDGNPLNDEEPEIDPHHFRTPTVLPIIGALACAFLVTPFSGRAGSQYVLAGYLLALGIALWAVTWFANRALRARKTIVRDPSDLAGGGPS